MILPLATLFLFSLSSSTSADELISARCQSKCLHDMEARYQDNQEQKRNLKHHIIQMCKDDAICSACATPCRESFSDVAECKAASCVDSLDKTGCEQSCEYLQRIFTEKPGACPKANSSSNYECSALCHLDGDCPETSKCCSSGCSRQCLLPKGRDPRLLPVPINIAIQERKRRRSIIIRWVMQKMTKEQNNANSNLFVVQWRWGLHLDANDMTEWQTVTVRNKPYAILKHLLSPGRFYEFRVGAVSIHGSLGFSKPSEPFKLSKEAKAPHQPRDISLLAAKVTSIGLWNQVVTWTPPISDLPIKSYQLSWAASSASEADSFEEMMRRRATVETQTKRDTDEDDEGWGIEARDRHSVIVPSHATQAEISGLFPNSVYIVEIHASVDSTEGELQGEKGIVFIRTADAYYSSTTQKTPAETSSPSSVADSSESSDSESIQSLLQVPTDGDVSKESEVGPTTEIDIQTPFFDGELQTSLNWLNARICAPGKLSFVVRVKKGNCREYQTHQNPADARWHDIKVRECSAVLRGLSFACDYHVQIAQAGKTESTLSGFFATSACDVTPSHAPIPCLTLATPIACSAHQESHSGHVKCTWTRDRTSEDTVIGYRIVLSSAAGDVHNITINPPQLREVLYPGLSDGQMYTVEVQAVTNRGLGRVVSTNFVSPSALPEDDDLIQRFPGGEIIELPLESSRSTVSLAFSYCISLVMVFRILYL